MRAFHLLTLLLLNLRPGRACVVEAQILICQKVPETFTPGFSSLLLLLTDAGEINATALQSDSLASVTSLTIDNSGVTGILSRAFASFPSLRRLSLNGNALTRIDPDWFSQPDVLTALSMMGNQLEELRGPTLSRLTNLTRLNLANNKIGSIDPHAFESQSDLAELDLSGNRLTQVPPQVFRFLRSARMRLDGNPWDCSCGVQGFVEFLKELQSRSLLEREMEVTCESPSSLSGVPVWNVSVCVTVSPTAQAGTHTSLLTGTTTREPTGMPGTKPSSPHKPDVTLSVTPGFGATTAASLSTPSPPPGTDAIVIPALSAVIVVLCLLLFAACFLALLRRRNRNDKTVAPEPVKGSGKDSEEEHRSERSGPHENRDSTESDRWGSEAEKRRQVGKARVQSAHAALFTAPCGVFEKDVCSSQDTNTAGETGGDEEEDDPAKTRSSDQNAPSESLNSETTPYLSIGAPLCKINSDLIQATEVKGHTPGHSSQMGQMSRIFTWPATAAQWNMRSNMKAVGETAGSEAGTPESIETPHAGVQREKSSRTDASPNILNESPIPTPSPSSAQIPSGVICHETPTMSETVCSHPTDKSSESKSNRETRCDSLKSKFDKQTDTGRDERVKDCEGESCREEQGRDEHDAAILQSADPIEEAALTSQGQSEVPTAAKGGSDSRAPPSGDDVPGFSNLLHEVVQNHGRWTRQRWRQTHLGKQLGN